MSLTALGKKNPKENNYSGHNRTNKKTQDKDWVKSYVGASKKPVQGHLGGQTLAHIFCRDGEDYDAKMEEMCCYSLRLPTNSKQGFKVAYYYWKQAPKYYT